PKMADVHATAAFQHTWINTEVIEDAIFAIGEGESRGHEDRLASRLLRATPPTTASGTFAVRRNESITQFAVRTSLELIESVLAIQGPPGTGKTYTGAQMICALVAAGKRVGVTATGHKVIQVLLKAVHAAATASKQSVELAHRGDPDDGGAS